MRLYATSNQIFKYFNWLVSESEKRAAVCAEVIRLMSEERKSQRLSMNQLAKKAGMTQPAISILEASQPNPKLDTLLRLSGAMNLDLSKVIKRALRKKGFPVDSR